MKKMYRLLLLCCMLSLAGCTVSNEGVKITRIEFAEPNKTISVYEEYVLEINHFPEMAPAPDYNIWTENNAVAVVSNGKVKGVGTGITTIFAGANVNNTDLLAIGTITVTDLIPSEIRFAPNEMSIHVGASKQPAYSVVPANSTLVDLVWSSSDDAVAVVDGEGIVTAKSIGETTITAKVRGTNVTDICKVTVIPAPVAGLKLSVDGVEPAEFIRVPVLLGNTLVISPVVYPEYAGKSVDMVMTRLTGRLVLDITDQVPERVKRVTATFYYPTRYRLTYGNGMTYSNSVPIECELTILDNKVSLFEFNSYRINGSSIVLSVYDENDVLLNERTVNASTYENRKTIIRGELFNNIDGKDFVITVSDDWGEDNVVNL